MLLLMGRRRIAADHAAVAFVLVALADEEADLGLRQRLFAATAALDDDARRSNLRRRSRRRCGRKHSLPEHRARGNARVFGE